MKTLLGPGFSGGPVVCTSCKQVISLRWDEEAGWLPLLGFGVLGGLNLLLAWLTRGSWSPQDVIVAQVCLVVLVVVVVVPVLYWTFPLSTKDSSPGLATARVESAEELGENWKIGPRLTTTHDRIIRVLALAGFAVAGVAAAIFIAFFRAPLAALCLAVCAALLAPDLKISSPVKKLMIVVTLVFLSVFLVWIGY